jgi:hypothetical protein
MSNKIPLKSRFKKFGGEFIPDIIEYLKDHIDKNPTHQMDYVNVEIIDRASSDFKLRMKELLCILARKPELNKQLNSQSKFEVNTILITKYQQHQQTKK